MFRSPAFLAALPAVLGLCVVTGCGDDNGDDVGTGTGDDTVQIAASFYPLQWMAEQVGGDHVTGESLTPPGAEPHDLELTPADVASIDDADLVVYLSDFQPAVDEAVDETGGDAVFDAGSAADLDLTFTPIEEGEQHEEEADSVDPHFWLDPTRLAAVADAFVDQLSEIDPSHADDFAANLTTLTERLDTLDGEFMTGLARCENRDLVTSHNAFGYLARRYDLTQIGITGLTPEDEPSPADLAAVTQFVEDNDVRTIYFETLVSPDIADTVAAEADVATDVLDPIEGLNDESQGSDYLEVMAANLANLRRGQPCS
jgi:zinc transport system substrate-binding protein